MGLLSKFRVHVHVVPESERQIHCNMYTLQMLYTTGHYDRENCWSDFRVNAKGPRDAPRNVGYTVSLQFHL